MRKIAGIAVGDEGVLAMDETGCQNLSCRESIANRHVGALECAKDDIMKDGSIQRTG